MDNDIVALERIERAAKQGEDIWEMVVGAGIQAQEGLDNGRWLIGDLALLVNKQYGRDLIGKFAKAINVETGRVREYRTVCKFWEIPHRQNIREECPTITYSHMREAMRLKSLSEAMKFILECSDKAWTVEEARLQLNERLGKPTPPPKLLDEELRLAGYDITPDGCTAITFKIPGLNEELIAAYHERQILRLVLYETHPVVSGEESGNVQVVSR